jgi:hypothetical protein
MKLNTGKLDEALASHRVEIAYLFGSQARGEAGPLSDADVAVLFEERMEPQARFHARVMLTSELPGILGISRVDVVDLTDAPPSLAFRVVRDGKVIRNKKEGRRIAFESRTMVRYWDTAHMRRQFEEAVLNHFAGSKK